MRSRIFCSYGGARRVLLSVLMVSGTLFAQERTGVPVRGEPEQYAAHVSSGSRIYAATVLPADQVKHLFAFDISKNYVVVEVACYPGGAPINVEPDSFVAKGGKDKSVIRSSDAITVAADTQQKNTPRPPSLTSPVYTEANVGFETGTDPYTGRRVHGVYGGGGVGVGSDPGPQFPSPGGWPEDRALLERQLASRSLPAGKFDRATAGYLYFPHALLKKKGKGVYQLEYLADAAGTVELTLPAKGR
jgi:hypothetical protein